MADPVEPTAVSLPTNGTPPTAHTAPEYYATPHDFVQDLAAIQKSSRERVKGTCEWLLERDEILAWFRGDNPQFLLLTGGPGIGKTMLFGYLVEELKKRVRQNPLTTLVFYSCYQRRMTRNTTMAILRGFLSQLVGGPRALFKYQLHDEISVETIPDDLDVLWTILLSILKELSGEVYLLVDGLDECEETSQWEFLRLFRHFFDPQDLNENRAVRAKFLVTCRSGPYTQGFDFGGHLRIGPEEVHADLSKFIQVRIDYLSRTKDYPPWLKNRIEETLRRRAGGTFLWVSPVLRRLEETVDFSQIEDRLQTLPPDLNQVYDRILSQIDTSRIEVAKFILRSVAMARRPLTLSELVMAQTLVPGVWMANTIPSAEHSYLLQENYKFCRGLVSVDPNDSTVHFLHESVQDYLHSTYLQTNADLSQYHIKETANRLIPSKRWR